MATPTRHSSDLYSTLYRETGFPTLLNPSLLLAARGQVQRPPPVWVMRQAGRYLPEFQAIRAQHDFFTLCRTADLACEVTVQPVRRYGMDAAIIFSDILVVPQAMGLEVVMTPGLGPQFPSPLLTPSDLSRVHIPPLSSFGTLHLDPYFDSLFLTRHTLAGVAPLFGFAGGPFTLLAYMIEGGGSEAFERTKTWMRDHTEATHGLLTMLTDVIIAFCKGQICAGAEILQVFESHAGVLSPADFLLFSLPYLARIATSLQTAFPDVPLVVFARGANESLEALMKTDFNVIGLDWKADISQARELATRYGKTLQGNLNPKTLHLTAAEIREETRAMMEQFAGVPYIANLGHGVEPTTDPARLQDFVTAVRSLN